jgi:hypothetical protein
MALADGQEPSRIAYEMGNSVRIIGRHYDALSTPSQAKAFYSLRPIQVSKVAS